MPAQTLPEAALSEAALPEAKPATRLPVALQRLRAVRWPVLPLVVALSYVLCVVLQEKIRVGNGFGWDGVVYGRWAGDFVKVLQSGADSYYVQRILPSGVIYAVLGALQLPRETPQLLAAFQIANVLLVASAAFSYEAIARRLRVLDTTRWLGALALFGNFAILKYSAFYPVLTDVWAFALGTLQVQLYLSRRVYLLSALTALGAFAWPTLLPFGACLLLFSAAPTRSQQEPAPAPWHLNDVLAGIVVLGWLWACKSRIAPGYTLGLDTGTIDYRVLRLSLLVAGAYAFWSVRQLLDERQLFRPRAYLQSVSLRSVLLTVGLVAAVTLARAQLTSKPGKFGLQSTLDELVFSTLKEPGLFALSHVLVWGPVLLLVMFRWRRVVTTIHQLGLGPTGVALCGVLLSMNAESRKLVNLAPFFYCFALPSLDRLAPSRKAVLAFGVTCLCFSRVWLEIDGRMKSALSEFPSQLLFMVIGPWMTPAMYALQLAIVVVTGLVILAWLRERERAEVQNGTPLADPPARPAE